MSVRVYYFIDGVLNADTYGDEPGTKIGQPGWHFVETGAQGELRIYCRGPDEMLGRMGNLRTRTHVTTYAPRAWFRFESFESPLPKK